MITLDSFFSEFGLEHALVLFMGAVSVLLATILFERLVHLVRVWRSLKTARPVVQAARDGTVGDAMQACEGLIGPLRPVLVAGLERTGPGADPHRAMIREQKRIFGAMKARTWILATAGALMPFVGLFGTVIGVMAAFQAIGESGQGGFAIVSVGISQALVATAVGIAVALEGVVMFNVLQTISQGLAREISLLSDELAELIEFERGQHASQPAK